MKLFHKILVLFFIYPGFSISQIVIDSTQDHELRYSYEKVYSQSEFESFKIHLLSQTETKSDSQRVVQHITILKQIQNQRISTDTSNFCLITYCGDPIDFIVIIDKGGIEINHKWSN